MKRMFVVGFLVASLTLAGSAMAARMICTGKNCTMYDGGRIECDSVECTWQ